MFVCVNVCCERECVCEREREREHLEDDGPRVVERGNSRQVHLHPLDERERVCVCACDTLVCVCVCVCVKDRECVSVCV